MINENDRRKYGYLPAVYKPPAVGGLLSKLWLNLPCDDNAGSRLILD